jgi:hypothetical protein
MVQPFGTHRVWQSNLEISLEILSRVSVCLMPLAAAPRRSRRALAWFRARRLRLRDPIRVQKNETPTPNAAL